MRPFKTKRNDTKPLQVTLRDANGDAVNVTGATIVFSMYGPGSDTTKRVNRGTVTLVTPASGIVKYEWAAGETDRSAGTYGGEFEVTDSSGIVTTYPTDHSIPIIIYSDIDSL